MITEFEEFIGSVRMVMDEQDGDDALLGRIVKIYWDTIQEAGCKCALADTLLTALKTILAIPPLPTAGPQDLWLNRGEVERVARAAITMAKDAGLHQ